MVYLDHRTFLPKIDTLQSSHKNFPKKYVPKDQPRPKTMDFVVETLTGLSASITVQERKDVVKSSGCTGDYALRRLPYHDRYLDTPVEPMHLVKNIAERIVKLLSGLSDSEKVREDEKQRKRFRTSWIKSATKVSDKLNLPPAPFSFSKEQRLIANQRAISIKSPSQVDWKPVKIFGKDAGQLKSNQWKHVVSSGILKFCIRGLLGKDQESTLNELCDVLCKLCAEEVDLQTIDSLEYRVHRVLSLMERDFPASVHVITLHLLHHLPMFIRRFGPVYGFWMYPMERFNNWIKCRVLNRRYPESTVIETYRLYELSFYLQLSGQLPPNSVADLADSVDDSEQIEDQLSRSVRQGRPFILDPDLVEELRHLYESAYPDVENSQQIAKEPCSVTQYKVYTIEDRYHRKIKFGSMLSEHENSVSISSYIHLKRSNFTFGRIQFIFEHQFKDQIQLFACVHWFADAVIDPTSELFVINKSTHNLSKSRVIFLNEISKPLVHATDEVNLDNIWILNHTM